MRRRPTRYGRFARPGGAFRPHVRPGRAERPGPSATPAGVRAGGPAVPTPPPRRDGRPPWPCGSGRPTRRRRSRPRPISPPPPTGTHPPPGVPARRGRPSRASQGRRPPCARDSPSRGGRRDPARGRRRPPRPRRRRRRSAPAAGRGRSGCPPGPGGRCVHDGGEDVPATLAPDVLAGYRAARDGGVVTARTSNAAGRLRHRIAPVDASRPRVPAGLGLSRHRSMRSRATLQRTSVS